MPVLIRAGTEGVQADLAGAGSIEPVSQAWSYPSRGSLLPAFLAIILAIATQRIVISLFAGSLVGAAWYLATGSGAVGAEVVGAGVVGACVGAGVGAGVGMCVGAGVGA